MNVNLDKIDLISLAKGTSPNFSIMDNRSILKYGNYNGSWKWNYNAFKDCTEEEILKIYYLCKNSWN